jgi:hypothetical protein
MVSLNIEILTGIVVTGHDFGIDMSVLQLVPGGDHFVGLHIYDVMSQGNDVYQLHEW